MPPLMILALMGLAFWGRKRAPRFADSRQAERPMRDVTPPAPKPARFDDPFARGAHHDRCFDAAWPARLPRKLVEAVYVDGTWHTVH